MDSTPLCRLAPRWSSCTLVRGVTRSLALSVPAVSEYLYPQDPEALRVYQLTPPQPWRQQRTRVRQERYRENGSHKVENLAGYFTAAQAREAGYSYQAQKYHADRGNWERVRRGLCWLSCWYARELK